MEEKRPELVTLLAAGADPYRPFPDDHADHPGLTPLAVARKRRHKKIIPLLEGAAGGSAEPGTAPDAGR
ncbi:MAG TPA: hypothetical protein VH092_14600 [Urbifossiella sp.]|nr:hypothetical protein [Urbifossiella sp.]